MNKGHEKCGSDEWRQAVRDVLLPWALGAVDLGDDVIEVGPGYGATTDVLSARSTTVTAVEIDDGLVAMLTERYADVPSVRIIRGDATRLDCSDGVFTGAACFTMLHHVPTVGLQDQLFSEIARVLRAGAWFVASDSLASPELRDRHVGDNYNPVDPSTLAARLNAAGFAEIEIRTNALGWAATARAN